jgi:large subunit ribosomal protein L21
LQAVRCTPYDGFSVPARPPSKACDVPAARSSRVRPTAPVMPGGADRALDQTQKETAVYAIVRAGSKQQKVAVGDVIEIDKTDAAVGDTLTLPVVMTVDGDKVTATGLDKAGVTVEVLGATKGPKIIIQKYKNKTGYKKRQGHRQHYTQVKVTGISA